MVIWSLGLAAEADLVQQTPPEPLLGVMTQPSKHTISVQ